MKRFYKAVISNVFLLIFFYLSFFLGFVKAEINLPQAFAEFINIIYSNTQSSGKSDMICVFGSDDVSSHMKTISSKVVEMEESEVKKISEKDCRIIYIAKNKEKSVKTFIADLNKLGIPTIAIFETIINSGGMIFVDIGRRDFELTVNLALFRKSNVKIDSSITALIINK